MNQSLSHRKDIMSEERLSGGDIKALADADEQKKPTVPS